MGDAEKMKRVQTTLKHYQDDTINRMSYMQKALRESSKKHQSLLLTSGLDKYLSDIFSCVSDNHDFLQKVLDQFDDDSDDEDEKHKTLKCDYQGLISCLLQIVREWSKEGEHERQLAFGRILTELTERFPAEESRSEIEILVPGCGLARLPFEIALQGFSCKVNEVDLFQLLIGQLIMNSSAEDFKIYPWVHDLSNKFESKEVCAPVTFPDIDPQERPEEFAFNVQPGDFLEAFDDEDNEESLDVIVTSFFLETAQNPLSYIDLIFKLLKKDGIWINFGSMNFSEEALALDWNTLKKIIVQGYPFEMVKDEIVISPYCASNPKTSIQMHCVFFTCQKK